VAVTNKVQTNVALSAQQSVKMAVSHCKA